MNTRIARSVAKALRDLPGEWDSFNMYEWLREDIFITPQEEGEACGTVACMGRVDGGNRRVAGGLPGGAGQWRQGRLSLRPSTKVLGQEAADALFAPRVPWPEEGRQSGLRYGRVTREVAAGLLEALADRADKGEEITPEVVQEEWMATDAWDDGAERVGQAGRGSTPCPSM